MVANDSSHPADPSLGIVVVGMHRSGTSLAAHLLGELGCSYGGDLMPAKDDNPLGFWEHAGVVDIHDDFLQDSGRSWSDPRPFSPADFASPAAERARTRLDEVFQRDFRDRGRWVLKDPRLCRLLPLWDRIFDHSGHSITFLHTIRHPLAVARSLARRNGFSEAAGLVLWLRHVVEAERATRGRARSWVGFEDLVQAPYRRLGTAIRRLGLLDRFDLESAKTKIDAAARPDHVHCRVEDDAELRTDLVRTTRRALLELVEAESAGSREKLDSVAAELSRLDSDPIFSGSLDLMARVASSQKSLATKLEAEVEAARKHRRKLEGEIAALETYCRRLEDELARKERHEATQVSYTRKLENLLATAGAAPPSNAD